MATDTTEKNSARPAIILVIVMIVIAAFAILRGLQTVAWLEARMWARANPWIREVPQPLTSLRITVGKATQIKVFNYEFASPWGEANVSPGDNYAQLRFKPGQVIVFYDPEAQLDTITTLRTSTSPQYQNFARVAGDIGTNYALYQAVYAASPAQVSPFLTANDSLRMHLLLLLKLAFGFDEKPPLYSFTQGSERGFQFGDPASGRPVALRVFDGRDHQFRFIFVVESGSSAKITQSDIDGIVQSLQPVPLNER
ncbi:MAG: hypothetical protein ACRD4S_05795 [Candidatus Acidiferrales bacterium]